MRKQINLVFITIIICTLLSCNKDEIVNSNGAMFGLLPLRSGNSWNYRRIWLDTNQTAIDTFNIAMTMYGPDTVGTFIGYGIQNFFWPFSISLFTNESDGLYAIDNPGDLPNPSPPPIQAKAFPYPTHLGDTLRFKMLLTRTKAMYQSLTVPAGTFNNCVVYDFYEVDSLVAEAYVSPNIGVIRMWAKYGTEIQMNDLISYSIH